MRRFLMAAMMIGAVQSAEAADMPDLPFLRGSFTDAPLRSTPVWQGYYVGGQGSWGSADMKFAGANDVIARDLMPYSSIQTLNLVPSLGKSANTGTGFGGFVGYNTQWEDVVVGVEANYIHGSFTGGSSPVPFRSTDATGAVQIQSASSASVSVNDYGSLRARAGYVLGSFLPYVFGGVAGGRADIDRSVSLLGNFDPLVTRTSSLKDHFIYGYSAGAGIDVMLVGGLFLRAEYEYQRFTSPVDININTVRAGLGYKF